MAESVLRTNRSTIMLLSSVRKHKTWDAVRKTFFIDYPVIQRRRDFMILEPGITVSLPVFFFFTQIMQTSNGSLYIVVKLEVNPK